MHEVDLQGLGRAFGFNVPPRVDLNLSARGSKFEKRTSGGKRQRDEGTGKLKHHTTSGHAFSADNPYGKRAANDKRQFSR